MLQTEERVGIFQAFFERLENQLKSVGSAKTHELRKRGIGRFVIDGFPTNKLEEWKFTNVRRLAETKFSILVDGGTSVWDEAKSMVPAIADEIRLVFVNGAFVGEASRLGELQPGVVVGRLESALCEFADCVDNYLGEIVGIEHHPFAALNTAFIKDGGYVMVPDGIVLERPVHLVFVAGDGERSVSSHPRSLIVIGKSAEATVIETHIGVGKADSLLNAVTELFVGDNGTLRHAKLQIGSENAHHMSVVQGRIGRASNCIQSTITLSGAIVRNDTGVELCGEGGECRLNGLFVGRKSQHADNHTTLNHVKPHCSSHELYKYVLDDSASAVFRGKIIVRPNAQKTDSKQSNMNLLLSDDASINTKPQLEIFADDVRCTHGATIGYLDADAIFYLRSRGIPIEAARHLLTFAFASEIIERLPADSVRRYLEELLFTRFAGGDVLPSVTELHA